MNKTVAMSVLVGKSRKVHRALIIEPFDRYLRDGIKRTFCGLRVKKIGMPSNPEDLCKRCWRERP